MVDESTFWLTLTNVLLGAVTVVLFLVVLAGTLWEIISGHKRKSAIDAELDHDLHEMFLPPPGGSGRV